MAAPPGEATVRYRGVTYQLNLTACRRVLVDCQTTGEFDGIDGLSDKLGISPSVVSRFLSCRPVSLTVTLAILEALHLQFWAVDWEDEGSETDGTAGVGAKLRPKPHSGQDGLALPLPIPGAKPVGLSARSGAVLNSR
jgi:hypothetical protein